MRSGNWPEAGISLVDKLFEAVVRSAKRFASKYEDNPPAKAFNIIVEITSLTPRLTLRYPAIAAHKPPTVIAISIIARI